MIMSGQGGSVNNEYLPYWMFPLTPVSTGHICGDSVAKAHEQECEINGVFKHVQIKGT